jgi:hemoglobin/transferrin/lactoferrin receptor protein
MQFRALYPKAEAVRHIVSVLIAIFCCSDADAQKVTIVSGPDGAALGGATAQDTLSKAATVADALGQVDVSSIAGIGPVRFAHIGFESLTLTRNALKEGTVVRLKLAANLQAETVVSASRFVDSRRSVAQTVESISQRDMAERNGQTTGDALWSMPGVFVQKSQMGGGSPVLRGFEANKVLMVMDGMRINNAIYRAGHLQNIISIDQSMLERAEVDYGPGNVMYGADALGGVIHFRTLDPQLNTDITRRMRLSNGTYVRYSSANNEFTGHIDVGFGFRKWGSLTSFTYSSFQDMRMGNVNNPFSSELTRDHFYVQRLDDRDTVVANPDPNMMTTTGYGQFDLFQKFLFRPGRRSTHRIMFQMSSSTDIPRYDNLEAVRNGKPRFAEWYYGPQDRYIASYSLQHVRTAGMLNTLDLTAHYQYVKESRHSRKLASDSRTSNEETVNVAGINLDLAKHIRQHTLRYGAELTYNHVSSEAYATDIVTEEVTHDVATRYPDSGSQLASGALYLSHRWEIVPEKLYLSEGVRYTFSYLGMAYSDTIVNALGGTSFGQVYHAANGNIGLVYNPTRKWNIRLRLASGFRAPNVDDVGKFFEAVDGNMQVPNPDLRPTYLYSAELGLRRGIGATGGIGITGHFSFLTDAVVRQAFTYNGQDSLTYNGERYGIIANQNRQQAYITGLTADADIPIWGGLSLASSVTYTYARILTDTVPYPLDHIPPLFGNANIRYRWKGLMAEAYMVWNGWKALADMNQGGEDRYETATTEGVPAWYTLNVRAEYNFLKYYTVQLALENILDQHYRPFASGLYGKGRNLMVCIRARL